MPLRYHHLATDENDANSTYEEKKLFSTLGYPSEGPLDVPADAEGPIRIEKKRRRRALHFGFLSLLAVLYMTFFIAKSFLLEGFTRPCHGKHHIGKHGGHQDVTFSKLPTHFTLPSGDNVPAIALGVWRAAPGELGLIANYYTQTALKAGYRHIDDAWIYGNEREVGEAIRASSVPRKDIWLTSKLWNTFHSPEDVEPALDESLARLERTTSTCILSTGSAEKVKESLEIPEVQVIAKETRLTPAQIYISWHIQRGTVVLPKSVHPARIEENFHVAPLSSEAFERLEKIAASHEPFRAVDPHWGIDIWN
ncbi:hypothetical protein NLJ89_g34 [Agrocybe chaxingu]|uniref:NADP-dependent oxidoreductase domain-containing protein n=1 Tax=Agrocybe chaxingu TaxID=84603 RepID=A0A9W8N2M9_9AGAR|nr:hypothetical protein NLJ89_g34 [Agrocybe chaxingu]